MKLAGAWWLLLLSVCALSAQNPSADLNGPRATERTGAVISGVVSKDPSGEPVKKALIELIAESQGEGGNYTALTGADGIFRIENIAPGRYRLFAERAGFHEIDTRRHRTDGRVLTLGAGQELKDLTIRLQAAAVVEGRVTDEDGEPMPEAQVAVLRRTFVAGHTHWQQVGAERTNDLGEYRVAGLAAGSYFVSCTPPPDFRSLIETTSSSPEHARNLSSGNDKAATAYQTTYYPGTRDRAQAAPIQLRGGDDFPVNFSLTPSPSLTIRGAVVNLPPGAAAAITLQSKDFSLVLSGAEMHKDGSFEIRDVSPGAYTILASVENSATPMMARQSLQLTTAGVDGLRLAPQSGGAIRGRVRTESRGGPLADRSAMFLMLRSADGDDDAVGAFALDGISSVAHVSADGSFEWKNVLPGHYSVFISEASAMPDWFVKSVSAGGRDVAEAGFSVSGGGTTTLDLLASANGAAVDGVAVNQKGEPVSDAVVVAVPGARLRNHPEYYRTALSDQLGRFTLRGLPPGDYTLFAWEGMGGEAYYNADFLKSYEGQGKALHVNEGDRKSVQLLAAPASDEGASSD